MSRCTEAAISKRQDLGRISRTWTRRACKCWGTSIRCVAECVVGQAGSRRSQTRGSTSSETAKVKKRETADSVPGRWKGEGTNDGRAGREREFFDRSVPSSFIATNASGCVAGQVCPVYTSLSAVCSLYRWGDETSTSLHTQQPLMHSQPSIKAQGLCVGTLPYVSCGISTLPSLHLSADGGATISGRRGTGVYYGTCTVHTQRFLVSTLLWC